MPSRREFVKTTLASAGIVAWGQTAPLFLSRTALAAGTTGKPGAKETVLVVVQLTGGNDGLNTVVPYADDGYGKAPQGCCGCKPKISRRSTTSSACIRRSTGFAGLLEDHSLCDRARGRLSEPERIALPLDGHLAGRQPGRDI